MMRRFVDPESILGGLTRSMSLLAMLSYLFLAPAALAGPQFVEGGAPAGFSQNGNTFEIPAPNNSIYEYTDFSIGPQETVNFLQEGAAHRVLNRVVELNPSQIQGALNAPGHVYIVNPAGIFFSPTANIKVGGLYSVAGALSNEDFLAHRDNFTNLVGSVENLGSIVANSGPIVLVGSQVANAGNLKVEDGVVALVAGSEVYLGDLAGSNVLVKVAATDLDPGADAPGVENTGTIDATGSRVFLAAGDMYSLAARQAGSITADDVMIAGGMGDGDPSRVEVSGEIDVSNTSPGETGGDVTITGEAIELAAVVIDASGEAGGGLVRVGGDLRGEGELPNASTVAVGSDASIRADALGEGDGGTVIIWSDNGTLFAGEITARGGPEGGDGGLIETSGRVLMVAPTAAVNATAPAGASGLWLLDTEDVSIDDEPVMGFPVPPGGGTISGVSIVHSESLNTALGNGTVVTITTDGTPSDLGNITVLAPILRSGDEETTSNPSTLNLLAHNDVEVAPNTGIVSTGGPLNVLLMADKDASGAGTVYIQAPIETAGGDFTATGSKILLDVATSDSSVSTLGPELGLGASHGDQTYDGPVELARSTVLEGNDVRFLSTVDSVEVDPDTPPDLAPIGSLVVETLDSLDTSGNVTEQGDTLFQGPVGSMRPLLSLETTGTGVTNIDGGFVTTAVPPRPMPPDDPGPGPLAATTNNAVTPGSQLYGDDVVLGADTILKADADVTFAKTVRSAPDEGWGLTVNAPGTTTFGGDVGDNDQPLAFLETDGPGATAIDGGSVTTAIVVVEPPGEVPAAATASDGSTDGFQKYGDAVELGARTVLDAEGNVKFASTVDGDGKGPWKLTVKTQADTIFGDGVGDDRVGAVDPLASVETDPGGRTFFNIAAQVEDPENPGSLVELPFGITNPDARTTGDQIYGDAVKLAQDTVLLGNDVRFRSTVDTAAAPPLVPPMDPPTDGVVETSAHPAPTSLENRSLLVETFDVGEGEAADRGDAVFQGQVGAMRKLASLETRSTGTGVAVLDVADSPTEFDVQTSGDQTYRNPVKLAEDTELSGNDVRFLSTVDTAQADVSADMDPATEAPFVEAPSEDAALVVETFDVGEGEAADRGDAVFQGQVGAMRKLASLETRSTGTGVAVLDVADSPTEFDVQTSGDQTYRNPVKLAEDTELSGNDVRFLSTVDTAQADVSADMDPATEAPFVEAPSEDAALVVETFDVGEAEAADRGDAVFQGQVGAMRKLASLETRSTGTGVAVLDVADSPTEFDVQTSGDQTYRNPVKLAEDTELSGNDVRFLSTVDTAQADVSADMDPATEAPFVEAPSEDAALVVETFDVGEAEAADRGDAVFQGQVGAMRKLASLETRSTGTGVAVLDVADSPTEFDVQTSGDQTYRNPVKLAEDTELSGNDVRFLSTVDTAQADVSADMDPATEAPFVEAPSEDAALVVETFDVGEAEAADRGDAVFQGQVGAMRKLASLETRSTGTGVAVLDVADSPTEFDVQTSGDQTYRNPVKLAEDTELSGNDVRFLSTVDTAQADVSADMDPATEAPFVEAPSEDAALVVETFDVGEAEAADRGDAVFQGQVGAMRKLASLETRSTGTGVAVLDVADSPTEFDVQTSGDQTYRNPVKLAEDTELSGNDVRFLSTVDTAQADVSADMDPATEAPFVEAPSEDAALVVETFDVGEAEAADRGDAVFQGQVGAMRKLASLETRSTGTGVAVLDVADSPTEFDVQTSGDQTYRNPVKLAEDTELSGNDVRFLSTVDTAQADVSADMDPATEAPFVEAPSEDAALVVETFDVGEAEAADRGDAVFQGQVGAMRKLASLETRSTGTGVAVLDVADSPTEFDVQTSGDQTYRNPVKLAEDTELSGNDVRFLSTVDTAQADVSADMDPATEAPFVEAPSEDAALVVETFDVGEAEAADRGDAVFQGQVGAMRKLASLETRSTGTGVAVLDVADSPTEFDVQTSGDQTYRNPVKLAEDTELSGNDVRFLSTVDTAQADVSADMDPATEAPFVEAPSEDAALVVETFDVGEAEAADRGDAVFQGQVGAMRKLASLETRSTGTGVAVLDVADSPTEFDVQTSGDQTYRNPVKLAEDTELSGNDVRFLSTVDTAQADVSADMDPATEAPFVEAPSEDAALVVETFDVGEAEAADRGDAVFQGQVGAMRKLASLETRSTGTGVAVLDVADSPTEFDVQTSGDQTYRNPVKLAEDTELSGNDVRFLSTVDTAQADVSADMDPATEAPFVEAPSEDAALVVETFDVGEAEAADRGDAVFQGQVGAMRKLASLETRSTGTGVAVLDVADSPTEFDVQTSGDQTYRNPVKLAEDTELSGNDVRFLSTVDTAQADVSADMDPATEAPFVEAPSEDAALVVETFDVGEAEAADRGDAVFQGQVGAMRKLASLETRSTGTGVAVLDVADSPTEFDVQTSGDQTYRNPVKLAEDTELSGNDVRFLSTVDTAQADVSADMDPATEAPFVEAPSEDAALVVETFDVGEAEAADRGDAVFQGQVGAMRKLASLETRSTGTGVAVLDVADSPTEFDVQTSGDQTYRNPVKLAEDTELSGNDVRFLSTVDTAQADVSADMDPATEAPFVEAPSEDAALVVETFDVGEAEAADRGDAVFQGQVGAMRKLASLETRSTGTGVAVLDVADSPTEFDVQTSGDQTYRNPVKLAEDTELSGNDVRFLSTVDTLEAPVDEVSPPETERSLRIDNQHDSSPPEGTDFGDTFFGDGTGDDRVGALRALASLEVTNSSSYTVFNIADGEGPHVLTSGDQSYAGAVELAQDAVLSGNDIEFGGRIDTLGGAPDQFEEIAEPETERSLGVVTFDLPGDRGDVEFGREIGGDRPLENFSVDTETGLIEFGPSAIKVEATGSIELNSDGRSPTPDVAGVFKRDGDLTFNSQTFTMGSGEKLTVVGDLTINASKATVADLSALEIDINAPDLTIQSRASASVRLPNGSSFTDAGADLVANRIELSDETPQVEGGRAVLATPTGAVEGNFDITSTSLSDLDVRLVFEDGSSLEESDFFLAGTDTVLDLAAQGPSVRTDVPGAIPDPGAIIRGAQPPPPAGIGVALAGAEEVIDFLRCAQLEEEEELPEYCERVETLAEGEVPQRNWQRGPYAEADAQRGVEVYRSLLRSKRIQQVRVAFQAALDDYRLQEPGPVNGADFRRFLAGKPEHAEAAEYLDQLKFLFEQLEGPFSEAVVDEVRQELLREVREKLGLDIEVEALDEAIETSSATAPPRSPEAMRKLLKGLGGLFGLPEEETG